MIQFMIRFGAIQSELASVLDEQFVPGEYDSQIADYLYETQKSILRHHNSGNSGERDYHLLRLQMFLKHLKKIEERDPDLFSDFREELKKEDYDNYYGTRFEIDCAASLFRKGVDFSHPDPPDFVIDTEGKPVIECTTSHISGGNRTVEQKLKQSIISKSGKPYFTSNSAIFIDITNLAYAAVNNETELTGELVKRWMNECISNFNLNIGSILIFMYLIETRGDESSIGHHYWRLENQGVDDTLVRFLNEHYPYGDSSVRKPYHPHDP